MPKVSDSYLETKREQILEAAVTCFAHNGFHETTIEDICQETGISHGAVYRYFKTKEDVIAASFEWLQETRIARNTALSQENDIRQAFDDLFAGFFRRRARSESETLLKFNIQFYGEAVRNPRMAEIERRTRNDMLEKTAAVFTKARERGEINDDLDVLALSRLVMALADGFGIQNAMMPGQIDAQKCLEAVRAVFFGNLWTTHKQEE